MLRNKRRGGTPGPHNSKTKKHIKNNRVPDPVPNEEIEDDEEEILSDEVDGIADERRVGDLEFEDEEGERNNDLEEDDDEDEEDLETADQKRFRLAKELIQKAQDYKVQKEEEDEFFLNDGVQRDEQFDAVTRALQLDHKKKTEGIFTPIADAIKESLEAKSYNVEIHTLKGHKKCATAIELDSTGKFLFSVSKDGSLIKWDLAAEKKAILNEGPYGKDTRPVTKELLCAALSFDDRYLITGGADKTVRLWDARDLKLIDTFKGHKDNVLGVKFKSYSHEFCSAGADRVLKLWDASERAYLDTFYGHQSNINAIDSIGENFVTCGFDRQVIYWKTAEGSQLLFKGGDYSLDSIRSVNPRNFVTGSQDGSISLWAVNKSKPLHSIKHAHGDCWMTAVGTAFNTDFIASGSYNNALNFYKCSEKDREITKLFELPSTGIVNDIKISAKADFVVTAEGDEHRLGRWITSKAKNRIKIYKIK